jgi:tRNA dimethylallyltransferase
MSASIPALVLFGPTASGKTEILEKLFSGQGAPFAGEVVSADSMQVYRGMDIGTAKPGAELLARLPHHLIDIRDPGEQFNAGEFVRLADGACADISGRGKLPVISGGTGFYLRGFALGLPETPPSDPVIRQTLKEELKVKGITPLAEELVRGDPVSARRIHINDEYRILRALEVFRLTGRPLSSYAASGSDAVAHGNHAAARPSYRFLILGLRRPREEVYRRIDERCAEMFRQGLPAEARRFFEAGYTPDDPGMRAIGYREFFAEGEGGAWRFIENPAGVETLVARNSRRYAKRQETFFASLPGAQWIDASAEPLESIRRELERFLESGRGTNR